LSGRANYCPSYTAFGIDRDGGQAPLVKIPGRFVTQGNVIPLPDKVSDTDAALLEPFSCVVNGIRVARIELGDTVVIYGAGPMGLMHVMLCRIAGAARIIVVDPLGDRLEHARALGCDWTLDPSTDDVAALLERDTDGRGVDVVVAACPAPAVQAEAIRVLAPFGRLCLFGGLSKDTGRVSLDTNAIHYGNLLVTGSTGGSVADFRVALKLVAGQRMELSRIVSDIFRLDNLQQAYDKALSGAAGKVVLVAE
jgi:threonine dehydrogenase-like Zn-dependent dehydrogenase